MAIFVGDDAGEADPFTDIQSLELIRCCFVEDLTRCRIQIDLANRTFTALEFPMTAFVDGKRM